MKWDFKTENKWKKGGFRTPRWMKWDFKTQNKIEEGILGHQDEWSGILKPKVIKGVLRPQYEPRDSQIIWII